MSEKQALIDVIESQLTDISTKTEGLITQANNLVGINEEIDDYTFSTFNQFKEEADSLNSDFDDLVNSENTFGLVDAAKTIAKETKLFKALTTKYINDLLPESVSNANELEQYRDDQDYFDKIQSSRTLIKWLNHNIKAQKTKLSANQAKLSQDFDKLTIEMQTKFPIIKQNIIDAANIIKQSKPEIKALTDRFKLLAQELNVTIPDEISQGFTIQGGIEYKRYVDGFAGEIAQPLGDAAIADSLLRQMNSNTKL